MSDRDNHTTIATTSSLRRARKQASIDSPTHISHAPWTAARCQRLLRPLEAKINHLRKLNEIEALLTSSIAPVHDRLSEKRQNYGDGREYKGGSNEEDGDWEANPRPRKKVKFTYSARACASAPTSHVIHGNKKRTCIKSRPLDMLPKGLLASGATISQTSDSSQEQRTENPSDTSRGVSKPSQPSNKQIHAGEKSWTERTKLVASNSRGRQKLFNGIRECLTAILNVTQGVVRSEKIGCSSLFSMCLKCVPEYILEEEYLMKQQHPDDDLDVSSLIYNDLEAMGISDGWKPLRFAVRAHGTFLVGEAIRDGSINSGIALLLVDYCLSQYASDAAQSFLLAALSRPTHQDKVHDKELACLNWAATQGNLLAFARDTDNWGFLYQQLTQIIEGDFGWKIGKHLVETSVTSAVQSIIQRDRHMAHAITLLSVIVSRACNRSGNTPGSSLERLRQMSQKRKEWTNVRSRTAANRVSQDLCWFRCHIRDSTFYANQACSSQFDIDFSNLLSMFSAIDVAQSNGAFTYNDSHGQELRQLLEYAAVEAQQYLEIGCGQTEPQVKGTDLMLSFEILLENELSSWLPTGNYAGKNTTCSTTLHVLSSFCLTNNQMYRLGSFVQNIANCYGHIMSEEGFDLIKSTVNALMTQARSPNHCEKCRAMTGKIAMAAAFAFSENTSQPSHLDWALNIEQAMCIKGQISPRRAILRTPARSTSQRGPGYRWEEGICEWIAKTPAIQVRQPSTQASTTPISDDGEMDILANTPMTTPEPDDDASPALSLSKHFPEMANSVKRTPRQDIASVKCVMIRNSIGGNAGNSGRPECETSDKKREKMGFESRASQTDGGYDDADELSAAQYAATEFSLLAQWQFPRTKSGLRYHQKRISPRLRPSNAKADSSAQFESDLGYSDAEDELSFS